MADGPSQQSYHRCGALPVGALRGWRHKTQATVNHEKKDGKQTIVPQFLEAMMWSASSQGARNEPACAMSETLVEGCTKKMMKQAEQAKKCTDAVPPKVRIMLNIAKARAEASNALVTFTTDGRTTAEVAHDTTQPQFKYTVDSSQTGCPRCSCEADRLTDWPCECACVAAHKKGVNDFSVLLNDHDKTPEWQDAYRYLEKKPILYPSTAVVYTEVESDLRLAAYVPIPSGRPNKKRMKSGLELQRERARTNGGFGPASSPAQPNMSSSQGAGPSSATAGSASARKRAPQMCTACGKQATQGSQMHGQRLKARSCESAGTQPGAPSRQSVQRRRKVGAAVTNRALLMLLG